jgi:hypothetical protein
VQPAAAALAIMKTAGTAMAPVNENPVQRPLADTGKQFRVVDCKYQYIVSIPR